MPAESLWIWRREPDGRQGICTDREHADRLRDYMDFEVIEVVPSEQLRGAVSKIERAMRLLDDMADDARRAMDAEVDVRADHVRDNAAYIRQILAEVPDA